MSITETFGIEFLDITECREITGKDLIDTIVELRPPAHKGDPKISKSEARRLLKQGAIRVNGERVDENSKFWFPRLDSEPTHFQIGGKPWMRVNIMLDPIWKRQVPCLVVLREGKDMKELIPLKESEDGSWVPVSEGGK
jgi:hypothetical protein